MTKHRFGGDWTTDKLERIRKYLCAYMTIFKGNPKARHFTTIYVDAFAGTGHRVDTATRTVEMDIFAESLGKDAESFKKGSARIALEVDPSFDEFIFIESRSKHVKELEALRNQFPGKAEHIRIEKGDANAFMKQWCAETDWQKRRVVVFLDPKGMQVEWSTLEAIARTQAIDLLLLFPLGVAVNRLLTKSALPPEKWGNALTRIFGTEDWKQAFYRKKKTKMLFETVESQRKSASPAAIGEFFLARLKTIFPKVADNPMTLRNSTNTPMYLLCFAAGNPRGAPTAVKIARDIFEQ